MRPDDDSFTGLDHAQRGRTPRGGAIYHLRVRTASRSKGQSARAACAYIERSAEYGRAADAAAELVYTESGHMPGWAEAEAGGAAYWDAADLYERSNGRLYKSMDFALPLALDAEQQRALAVSFAHHSDRRRTAALHPGDPRRQRREPALSPDDQRADQRRPRALGCAVVQALQRGRARSGRGAQEHGLTSQRMAPRDPRRVGRADQRGVAGSRARTPDRPPQPRRPRHRPRARHPPRASRAGDGSAGHPDRAGAARARHQPDQCAAPPAPPAPRTAPRGGPRLWPRSTK